MSFTAEVKDELSRVPATCTHCDKATLAALVRIEGTLFVSGPGRYRVEVATDVGNVARLIIKLLHGIYHLKTDLTVRRSVLHKTPNYLIEVPSTAPSGRCPARHGRPFGRRGAGAGHPPGLGCGKALLRGRLPAGGVFGQRVHLQPAGDFHFEITVESESLAEGLVALMKEQGIHARIMQRRSTYMVYLKSGAAILEFLAFTGAHHCALAMENERVVKSVRNDVNRMTNAEVANQAKSANAAVDQLFAIRTVLEAYGMENLPPALQDFIKLRVAFPDATLKEAWAACEPAPVEVGGLPPRPPHRADGQGGPGPRLGSGAAAARRPMPMVTRPRGGSRADGMARLQRRRHGAVPCSRHRPAVAILQQMTCSRAFFMGYGGGRRQASGARRMIASSHQR